VFFIFAKNYFYLIIMEQAEQLLEEWGPKAEEMMTSLSPVEWGITGSVIFLLFLIRIIYKSSKKSRALRQAPKLSIKEFQISPLGKDAFLKLQNDGEKATLSSLDIKGRPDIKVTSAVAGHIMEPSTDYGILLQINSMGSIKRNFTIELTFQNQSGVVYRQSFPLAYDAPSKLKIVRYA
jgi:hypothetical protein